MPSKPLIASLAIIIIASSTVVTGTSEKSQFDKMRYTIKTLDGSQITLYRYRGDGPPILMIPGMFENHIIFDSPGMSFARYMSARNFDVWILDLRTHDGDGDPVFDREYIDKNWDFDKTYLKYDLVKAIDFVKKNTDRRLIIVGHSMGGYLCYAYLELYGDENISTLITLGSVGVAYNVDMVTKILRIPYGKRVGNRIIVSDYSPSYLDLNNNMIFRFGVRSEVFNNLKTPPCRSSFFIKHLDREPAGVVVDMMYGFDRKLKNGHWIDPQTFYDYTENLSRMKIPVLLVTGSDDKSDPPELVEKTFSLIGSKNKTLYEIKGYGHADLLLGRNADRDVYQKVYQWLRSSHLSE